MIKSLSSSRSQSRSRSRHASKRKRTRSRSPVSKNKVLFITSFGAEDHHEQEQAESRMYAEKNAAQLALNESLRANAQALFNAKLLKSKKSSMSPRSSRSRSRTRSPPNQTTRPTTAAKNEDSAFKNKYAYRILLFDRFHSEK